MCVCVCVRSTHIAISDTVYVYDVVDSISHLVFEYVFPISRLTMRRLKPANKCSSHTTNVLTIFYLRMYINVRITQKKHRKCRKRTICSYVYDLSLRIY